MSSFDENFKFKSDTFFKHLSKATINAFLEVCNRNKKYKNKSVDYLLTNFDEIYSEYLKTIHID